MNDGKEVVSTNLKKIYKIDLFYGPYVSEGKVYYHPKVKRNLIEETSTKDKIDYYRTDKEETLDSNKWSEFTLMAMRQRRKQH